jgi:hypothetical protein
MIGSDYKSKSAHWHARRQQIDFRIKRRSKLIPA